MKIQTNNKYSNLKKWGIMGAFSFLFVLFFIGICNFWVEYSTRKQVFPNLEKIPFNNVGLVLGTSKYLKGGYQNPYFYYRIAAAAKLYHAGKVKHLLVSGDNGLKSYNEPKEMQAALMAKGVPESAITLDYAGFRTLDSVVRSKAVFGQQKITIISQKFHNQRALFIANRNGINAVGYNAKNISFKLGIKTMVREYLARCKAILDMTILNKQPKFLGEQVNINI